MYEVIREKFRRLTEENGLLYDTVAIKAKVLSTEEAIGNPEDRDYPLIVGRERLMQADFRGSPGQAFTDMYGDFNGRLSEIVDMELKNNFRRAIFISSLNAVMRYLGLVDKTAHCKNDEPPLCSRELAEYVETNYGQPKVAFVGFQPRMVEALAPRFEMRVNDLDGDNIGQEKFGITIQGPDKTQQNLDWCDLALVTGSTIANGTFSQFVLDKPVIFYGVSIAGAANLLGLNNFCYYGH